MFFNKKIISAVAAVAMMLTSFGAVTVSAATDPKLVVDVETRQDWLLSETATMGVVFTLNCDAAATFDTLQFDVVLPTNTMTYLKKGSATVAATAATIKANILKLDTDNAIGQATMQFTDTQKDVGENLIRVQMIFTALPDVPFTNGDYFEFDFTPATTWEAAPVGSFKVSDVNIRKKGELNMVPLAFENNAEVKAPASTGTPSIGGTDKNAVESFAGYADAANLGVFTNPDLATDKAVAFKTTVTGTTATGVVVWKVTSGGVSKYHKMSIGNKLTGGGDAAIGLAVEGLDDSAATAGVAFLQ